MSCPSSEQTEIHYNDLSIENNHKANYVACFGGRWMRDASAAGSRNFRGVFGAVENVIKYPYGERIGTGKGTKFGDMIDGSSNSVAFSEVLANHTVDGRTSSSAPGGMNRDVRGSILCPQMGGNSFSGLFPPNSRGTDVSSGCPAAGDPAAFPATHPMFCTQNRTTGATGGVWNVAARSRHPGGVNAAMADGSVRFVTGSVAQAVWSGMCTIAGGETVTLP
jgi:prepilin-type processing-associated H-X9-DG protein